MLCSFLLLSCGSGEEPENASALAVHAPVIKRPAPGQPEVWVDLEPASDHFGHIYLLGIDTKQQVSEAELSSHFKIFQNDIHSENPATPQMLGRYVAGKTAEGDWFAGFIPRFPLIANLSYHVVYQTANDAVLVDTVFSVPQFTPPVETIVEGVFPSADTLPENLLKFYIHFSGQMAEGRAYEHLSIIDKKTGKPVNAPFVVMEPELWDPDHQRFTLLFDPGRIKRSVGLNLELGPPLKPGHSYDLVIDPQWKNAQGLALSSSFVKSFHVIEGDREMPVVADWVVTPPAAESRQSLSLHFDEPLDHALLQRLIQVLDADGRSVAGSIMIGDMERMWYFTPEAPWAAGKYEIRVDAILEDVAGNTLRSLFDVDLYTSAPSEVREAIEFESLFFEVTPITSVLSHVPI